MRLATPRCSYPSCPPFGSCGGKTNDRETGASLWVSKATDSLNSSHRRAEEEVIQGSSLARGANLVVAPDL